MEKIKLIIIGDAPIAEVAYEYFLHDSPYKPIAFSVENAFITKSSLFGLPVFPFEKLEENHSPQEVKAFVAVGYPQLNRLRTRLVAQTKKKGFECVSYLSSKAFIWPNVHIGENCFILEHNVLQPFVVIGNNVTLWSGNHIGHHSKIENNCFIASHVVVSGSVTVEPNCFIGVNATIANNVTIKKDCVIGAGVIILRDTEEGKIYGSKMTEPKIVDSRVRFGVPEQ